MRSSSGTGVGSESSVNFRLVEVLHCVSAVMAFQMHSYIHVE
jgi:hypothetical protein